MSTTERLYAGLKAVMLMQERFDGVDKQLGALSTELKALAASHARLAERVARIEGVMEGYERASLRQLPGT